MVYLRQQRVVCPLQELTRLVLPLPAGLSVA
jgi:hypothetical protein